MKSVLKYCHRPAVGMFCQGGHKTKSKWLLMSIFLSYIKSWIERDLEKPAVYLYTPESTSFWLCGCCCPTPLLYDLFKSVISENPNDFTSSYVVQIPVTCLLLTSQEIKCCRWNCTPGFTLCGIMQLSDKETCQIMAQAIKSGSIYPVQDILPLVIGLPVPHLHLTCIHNIWL